MAQILLVENHTKLRANVQELLQSEGNFTVEAGTFVNAQAAASGANFDLVVLALELTDGD